MKCDIPGCFVCKMKPDPGMSMDEKAALIEQDRLRRLKAGPQRSTLTYPGFQGEPSILPGRRKA